MSMEQKRKHFKKQLALGEEGEHEVAQWLLNKGATVMPLYQFENDKAPVLFYKKKHIISPDLICFRQDAFMVEVKTKNQWVRYRGRVETGLNKRHYDEYEKIRKRTNKKLFVFFNHKTESPTGLFYCKLNAYTRIWDGMKNGERKYNSMVFYNFNVLNKL